MENGAGYRGVLALFLIISFPLLLLHQKPFSNSLWNLSKVNKTTFESDDKAVLNSLGTENHTMPNSINKSTTSNKLLDGLLPLGFDVQTCLSRYESHLYRKSSPYKPSSYLVSKLRAYERLHRRCGPNSSLYNTTITKLTNTNHTFNTKEECNYIVALPINGLGNRMISLASTFLYAILTNRVLLVSLEKEMSGLFCEPFLDSTWQLPSDFPHRPRFVDVPTFASLVEKVVGTENANELVNTIDVPTFVNVDLHYENPLHERFFHCGKGQVILNRVPILILKSDQYFAPSLFMVPSFERELNAMFPTRDAVFHHLGRYLFSPSNQAWSQITRFYNANLSKAATKIGIQVRVFSSKLTPSTTVTRQILACTRQNNILPKVFDQNETTTTSKAILVTSLYKEYSENLRAIYKRIQVYQPSHEGVQRYNNNSHHMKALMEIYLLSLCDELVTSGQSTFGYVAQGLGGIKAWIMYKTVGTEFSDPPCIRALSMEPCYQFPPRYDCKSRILVKHLSLVFPDVRRCEDTGIGFKMVS